MKKTILLLMLACAAATYGQSGGKQCYLIVPAPWASSNDSTVSGANVLKVFQDTSGRHVVSLNAVNEFPELFEGIGQTAFPIIWLAPNDFHKTGTIAP